MILVANLGNRNITLSGNTFSKELHGHSFREWSKSILDQYEECHVDLDINIINPLINNDLKQIVLCYSDQAGFGTSRIHQDTIYEAEIIQRILVDKYNIEKDTIKLYFLDAIAIDNKALMNAYRKLLRNLKNGSQSKIIICDAGGTPQQKMSLKVMAEYLLPRNRYEVKYAENNIIVSDVNVDEYRSIIDKEIAIKLIHQGEFYAANEILGYKNLELFHFEKNWAKKLYAHVFFRFIGNYNFSRANLSGKEKSDILINYYAHKLDSKKQLQNSGIKTERWIQITDKLRKAYFFLHIQKYSDAVMSFAHFYEELLGQYYVSNFDIKIYGSPKNQSEYQKDNFKEFINRIAYQNEFRICETRYPDFRLNLNDLGTLCMLSKYSKTAIIRNIAFILSPHLEFTSDSHEQGHDFVHINRIRNKVAHNGLYITEAMIKSEYSFIAELIQKSITLFNFTYKNLFQNLFELLEEKILRI